jgi:hypothetical protein
MLLVFFTIQFEQTSETKESLKFKVRSFLSLQI